MLLLKTFFCFFTLFFPFSGISKEEKASTTTHSKNSKTTANSQIASNSEAVKKPSQTTKIKDNKKAIPFTSTESKLNNNFFNEATVALRKKQKELTRENFPYILQDQVCLVLEKAKKSKNSSAFIKTQQESFFIEVVKTYDLVLEHTLDHNYFYCIYNYFTEPKPKLIMDLTKTYLTKDKRKIFLDRLNTCHQVELFGNGDNPDMSFNNSYSKPLPLKDYLKLSESGKLKFSNKLRKAYLVLEKDELNVSYLKDTNKEKLSFQEKLATVKLEGLHSFFLQLLNPPAHANTKQKCLIGGILRDRTYSSHLNKTVCSARKNNCNDKNNTFQCGALFNSTCISLHPIKTISQRCYKSSQGQPLKRNAYNSFINTQNPQFFDYCDARQKRNHGQAGVGCNYYFKVIEELNALFKKEDEQNAYMPDFFLTDTTTESDYCDDCNRKKTEKQDSFVSIIQNVVDKTSTDKTSTDKDSDLVSFLSDRVYENTSCKCKTTSDACYRGCIKSKKKNILPKTRCVGTKPINKSTKNCMRHASQAMMDTIDTFLKAHCKAVTRNQCLEIHDHKPKEKNICNQSFVFPSALCGLGLGLGEKERYNQIKNKSVKKKCKKWHKHNTVSTLTIPVVSDDGNSIEHIPLFEEISPLPEPNKKDPNDPNKDPYGEFYDNLPTGSIIIMESNSKHGHIDIKTNKEECGPNKDKICYCSDFCEEREGGYKPPFKPRAVFKWHPKLIEHYGNQ